MWPWEHAAVGYLTYSLSWRAVTGQHPLDEPVLVLLVGTQLPDVVDKPLSWAFGITPSGFGPAHSVFVALALTLLGVLAVRGSRRRVRWTAFLFGYWSHLVGDVVDPVRSGDAPRLSRVLYPVVTGRGYDEEFGLWRGVVYLQSFVVDLLTEGLGPVGALYLLVPLPAVALWWVDGRPGPRALVRFVRRARTRGGRDG